MSISSSAKRTIAAVVAVCAATLACAWSPPSSAQSGGLNNSAYAKRIDAAARIAFWEKVFKPSLSAANSRDKAFLGMLASTVSVDFSDAGKLAGAAAGLIRDGVFAHMDATLARQTILGDAAATLSQMKEDTPAATLDLQRQFLSYLAAFGYLNGIDGFDAAVGGHSFLRAAIEELGLLGFAKDQVFNVKACAAVRDGNPNNAARCAAVVGNLSSDASILRQQVGLLAHAGLIEGAIARNCTPSYGRAGAAGVGAICADRQRDGVRFTKLTVNAADVPASRWSNGTTQWVDGWRLSRADVEEMRKAFDKAYPLIAANGTIPPMASVSPQERALAEMYYFHYVATEPSDKAIALQRFAGAVCGERSGLTGCLAALGSALTDPDVRATLALEMLRNAQTNDARGQALKLWAEAVTARSARALVPESTAVVTAVLERRYATTTQLLEGGVHRRIEVYPGTRSTKIVDRYPDGRVTERLEMNDGSGGSQTTERGPTGAIISVTTVLRDRGFTVEIVADAMGRQLSRRDTEADGSITIRDGSDKFVRREVPEGPHQWKIVDERGRVTGRRWIEVDPRTKTAIVREFDFATRVETTRFGTNRVLTRDVDSGRTSYLIGDVRCDDNGCRRNDRLNEALFQNGREMQSLLCDLFGSDAYSGCPAPWGISENQYQGIYEDGCRSIGPFGSSGDTCAEEYREVYLYEDRQQGHLVEYLGNNEMRVYLAPYFRATSNIYGRSAGPMSNTGMIRVFFRMKGERRMVLRNTAQGPVYMEDPSSPPAAADFTWERTECPNIAGIDCNGPALIERYKYGLEAVRYGKLASGEDTPFLEVVQGVGYGPWLPRGGLVSAFSLFEAPEASVSDLGTCATSLGLVRVELAGPSDERHAVCMIQTSAWQIDFIVPTSVAAGQYAVRFISTADQSLKAVKLVDVLDPYPGVGRDAFDRSLPQGWVVRNVGGEQRFEALTSLIDVSEGEVWIALSASGLRGRGDVQLKVNGTIVAPDYIGEMPGTLQDQINLKLDGSIGTKEIVLCAPVVGYEWCTDPVVIETTGGARGESSMLASLVGSVQSAFQSFWNMLVGWFK